MQESEYDFLVIGSGPGGYTAAIRAAQLGLRSACVEKDEELGGTCLNVGCIPSKALLDSTALLSTIQTDARRHGINAADPTVDLAAMMRRKTQVVSGLGSGIASLFKKNGVARIRGRARMIGADRVEVTGPNNERQALTARHLVIATGSAPIALPGVAFDEDRVLSSTGALSLKEVPGHLLIVGGGVIGLELGSVWLRLGARVTILELSSTILPGMDSEMVKAAEGIFRKQGFDIRTRAAVTGVERTGSGVRVTLQQGSPVEADRVLVAVGRQAYTEGLGVQEIGVPTDRRGAIQVDGSYRSGVGNIYAIGDVIGGLLLAHKAMEEGAATAEIASGKPGAVDYESVASAVYTSPEIATVGLSEDQAREAGREILVGRFPFRANGRARVLGETEGFVKMIADARSHRLLGVHILGPRASDLIASASIGMEFQACVEDIGLSVYAHPTLPEALKESALAALGRAIHF